MVAALKILPWNVEGAEGGLKETLEDFKKVKPQCVIRHKRCHRQVSNDIETNIEKFLPLGKNLLVAFSLFLPKVLPYGKVVPPPQGVAKTKRSSRQEPDAVQAVSEFGSSPELLS